MTTVVPDPAHALTPTGNLRRRLVVSRLFQGLAVGAAALSVGILVMLVIVVVANGAGSISLSFFTSDLPATQSSLGGIGPALVGIIEITLIAALISVPIGVMTALFITEFAGSRIRGIATAVLELLGGAPPIVIGLFVYGSYVEMTRTTSGLAGSLALSVIMAPLIARSTMESLARIPDSWRDAALALGVSRWRTVSRLILTAASSSIVTASVLAMARAAGDTALLLFTTGGYGNGLSLNPLKPMANLPLVTYNELVGGTPESHEVAWGAALVLMVGILFVNIVARVMLRRGERKRGL